MRPCTGVPAMTSASRRGRLCFFAPFLYPIAVGGEVEFAGGTEVIQWLFARALGERGFDVTVATCDFGQGPRVVRDGVTLLRTFAIQAGAPGFRFVYPRLWKSMGALLRADADAYVANGSGVAAGWAYDAARLRRSRFVFLASSDGDAVPSLPWLASRREKWWYLRALRGADACVAQTEVQRHLFSDNFGVETAVIPPPVELPSAPVDAGANDVILWLSTYKPSKRPEWFIELARLLPDRRFVMVGFNPADQAAASWEPARRAATELRNLEVHGFIDRSRVGDFLSRAAVFVHTSPTEGFPMTLLEAWARGIPSVSAVDPGGVVERYGLGEVVSTRDALVEAVARLMGSPERRAELGGRARRYVAQHHGPEHTSAPLAELLDRVIDGSR
jgi:glycosyltransferase involved in cell wall biosynthesis